MSDFKENVKSDAFWLKTLYLVGFYFLFRLLGLALLVLAIVQWGHQLFTGQPSPELKKIGYSLGLYSGQIVHFLSGASNNKPFPFAHWPE